MDLKIAGDVVAVVGGGRGIGRAIADAFLAEGATVAVVDRDPGGAALGLVADVGDERSVRSAADAIFARTGRCDHVVFAAAVGSGSFGMPFWNLEPSHWERVLKVNLLGAAHVAHAFAPRMAERRTGSFLFIGSVAGQIGSQTDPPYSASKAGLINFAQCAARDLAPLGVRVNVLNPGMVRTELNRSVWEAAMTRLPEAERTSYDDWAVEKIRRLVPLGRWQEPEDIAAMAVFLASPRARNVTGQTINVDGGYVMHW
ncbi:MAG: SDR family NAD(P)-dependent oxidoreductase [Isosphaeraceae bacterium]|nr:SDR family NAD(P)-dependent oxidoreductase [Isosphaeraceae bacterium]